MFKRKTDFDYELLAPQLWELSESAFPYKSPWTVAQFKEDLKTPHSLYFLVEIEGELRGYLVIHQLFDEGEVINIAVSPAFKGQQLGFKLFQAALAELAQDNLRTLFLEVRETNEPALNLYHKIGFREIGRRKKYYHHPVEDGLVMKYQLTEVGG